jgi:hypothetical protein
MRIKQPFYIGENVRKKEGYLWPGSVVSVFLTLKMEWRIVVECTAPEVRGALHIFNPDQLKIVR